MDPHFLRGRCAKQMHRESHHDRALGQVMLVMGVLADTVRGRSELADQIVEIHASSS
jgi:hypothetical protein